MGEKLYVFNGPRMAHIPEASQGVFDLFGPGTVVCFRHGDKLTEEQYDGLSDEGKAKIDALVADGFITVTEKE